MTPFALLSPAARALWTGLLFLAGTGLLLVCLYGAGRRAPLGRRVTDAVWFGLVLALLAVLIAGAAPGLPWLPAAAFAPVSLLRAGLSLARTRRESREKLTPASVREALDDLNAGILFSDEGGRTVLINAAMLRLGETLTGGYPQLREELDAALLAPPSASGVTREEGGLMRFPDGRVWRFETRPLTDARLRGFTQTAAWDVTAEAAMNAVLQRENETLRETIRRTRRMTALIEELVPQEEALSLKIRVHDDIGASLIALSGLAEGDPGAETDAQVKLLSEALGFFATRERPGRDTLEKARRQAETMRVTLTVRGDPPRDPVWEDLLAAAARACVTNCVRHARGSAVTCRVEEREGVLRAVFENDGERPRGPIAEGGGLAALRKKTESLGGAMETRWSPRFQLILSRKEESA